jgi:hypothetical protein
LFGCGKARVDGGVGGNAVGVLFGWEWLYKDGIAIAVEGDHDVLVAAA